MTPERWQQVNDVFHSALGREPAQRVAFLNQACAGDDELRSEVESLIRAHQQDGSFIDAPAVELAAPSLADDQTELAVGQAVTHYKIVKAIGAGGMGKVYLAQDNLLHRKVAIKLLPASLSYDKQLRARFIREAQLASALDHPNICTVFEVGEAAGQHFIVMQYIEGDTLKQVIGGQPLRLDSLLSISLQVADALASAHAQGIIHRDIKSSNIIITPRGQAKVLDFGLAKSLESGQEDSRSGLTQTGEMLGTPSYMSPEQARGERVDERADIFSFGVVLYEMATGRVPFQGKSTVEMMNAVINEPHPPVAEWNPGIPPQLSAIIDRALAKDPADRYQSSRESIIDLQHIVTQAGGLERLFNTADMARGVNPFVPLKRRAWLARVRHWAKSTRRMMPLATAAVVALIGLMFLAYYLFLRPPPLPQPTAKPAPIRAIAVLPFKPLVAENRDEALELGMADSVILKLSNLKEIIVRPISSVRKYAALDRDPLAAGREQGVDAVLDASLQTAGERVRVSVRLLRVSDGATLWAYKCDEQQCANLFEMQDAIAEKVAGKLVLMLSGGDRELLAKRYTDNVEAYRLYSTGRYYWNKRIVESLKRSVEQYEQAINLDPSYALAYAGLADSYTVLVLSTALPSKEAMPKAKIAARRALELDDSLAEAHVASANVKFFYDWDLAGAEEEYKRAIELKPNDSMARMWYGGYLANIGRFDAALPELKLAQEYDPMSLTVQTNLGMVYYQARQYDQAIAANQKVLDMNSGFSIAHSRLAQAYEQKGMYKEAIAEIEKMAESEKQTMLIPSTHGAVRLGALGHAYAEAGNNKEAQKMLDRLNELSKQTYVSPYEQARIYAGLGEREQAFTWLGKSYGERDYRMILLKVEPLWDNLRSDPRFTDLLRRMGLSE